MQTQEQVSLQKQPQEHERLLKQESERTLWQKLKHFLWKMVLGKQSEQVQQRADLLACADILATCLTSLFPSAVSKEDRDGIASTIYEACQEAYDVGEKWRFRKVLARELVHILGLIIRYRLKALIPPSLDQMFRSLFVKNI